MPNPLVDLLLGAVSPGVPHAVFQQLEPWVTRFVRALPAEIGPQLRTQRACAMREKRGVRRRRPCGELALCSCISCGKLVCLGHAYVSRDAKTICAHCAREAEPVDEAPADRRAWALGALGLPESASFADAKAKFRELSALLHPDRIGDRDKKDRAAAERMYKTVTEAYHLLESRERKVA